jgi:hypothetical protein
MKRDLLFLLILIPLAANCQYEKNTKMTHILKNKNLEIHIDLPLENYNFSRFDWTGKITSVKYKDIPVSGIERTDIEDDNKHGKGFYNEFGIEIPVGYNEAKEGEWFPKIGVGLLKKQGEKYLFTENYEIKPAEFKVESVPGKLIISCQSPLVNGYSYVLKKEIELTESGFVIRYLLKNTGVKLIATNEYVHNFLAIHNDLIGSSYILKFAFPIKPELFDASVNPEKKVEVGQSEITFNGTPAEQFFFSNLTGNQNVDAYWELLNTKNKIGISETGSFKTSKVNLWGWKHVISPELFFDIRVEPGQELEWSRTYKIFEIN